MCVNVGGIISMLGGYRNQSCQASGPVVETKPQHMCAFGVHAAMQQFRVPPSAVSVTTHPVRTTLAARADAHIILRHGLHCADRELDLAPLLELVP